MIGNSESVKEIWTDLTRSDKNYFKITNGRFINSGIHHSNDMEPFSKIRINRLNSEKFQNYSFDKNLPFLGKIEKMITRVSSWIWIRIVSFRKIAIII